jgi:hypothetical protein
MSNAQANVRFVAIADIAPLQEAGCGFAIALSPSPSFLTLLQHCSGVVVCPACLCGPSVSSLDSAERAQSEPLISAICFADSIYLVRRGTRAVARARRNHPAFAPSNDGSNVPKARDGIPECHPQRAFRALQDRRAICNFMKRPSLNSFWGRLPRRSEFRIALQRRGWLVVPDRHRN